MNRAAQSLGRLGGKAGTGAAKARTSEQARAAVQARLTMWRAKVYDVELGGRGKRGKPVRVTNVIWDGHGSVSPNEARTIARSLMLAAGKADTLRRKYRRRWDVVS